MKATWCALGAVLCYTVVKLIIDRKLRDLSPIANMVFFYSALLTIALPITMFREQIGLQLTMPKREDVLLLLFCGLLFFVADFCYFSAFKSQGSLLMISTTMTLFPVLASIMKVLMGEKSPSGKQIVGWVLAVIAIALVTQENKPPL